MRRATLKDVAARAGVHVATASRALNETSRHLVNSATLDRVLRAATELGYSGNLSARTLRTARSMAIGILLPDLTNPIFPPIVRGAEDILRERGYSTWIANTDDDPKITAASIEAFLSRGVDGFISAGSRLHDDTVEQMAGQGHPLVLVNRTVDRRDIPSVTADDDHGVRLALSHFVELGHRKIVHLAGPQDLSTGVHRKRAFVQGLADHGLDRGPERVAQCDAWSQREGHRVLSGLLRDEKIDFTAIVAGNDLIALGCYDALREHGMTCPHDVSIIGFNDTPFMDHVSPPMTTIRIPQYDLGREAAKLLVDNLENPEQGPRSIVLPVELVNRRSTAPLRTN
ncbi:LacI family DNA-binding transcriptional regulator [Amycolatopsis sp. NPDC050768]|uniref:LacI family DNA-binding transcriptional regulator n=1 Tax=Amycolatopsis sp. NPDC050768 TaxID=3154839 RepID=UPI0033DF3500